jgi:hypothetical protein
MKKVLIAVCLALGGCSSRIYSGEMNAANVACEPFGGVRSFVANQGNQSRGPWRVEATCDDRTVVEYTLTLVPISGP